MRFVQLLLTDEQAEWTAAALRDAEKDLKAQLDELGDDAEMWMADDAAMLGRLSMLFQDAAEQPSKYPPTGKRAATVRTIVRRAKGAAQPQSRKNKRKSRQERRMRTAKERRRLRREVAESWNRAREIMEREAEEAREAYEALLARVADQPKYQVLDSAGNVVLDGIPAEFVRRVDDGASVDGGRTLPEGAGIIVPHYSKREE